MFSRLTAQWLTGCPAVPDMCGTPSAPTMSASVDNTISHRPFVSLADADPAGACGVSVIIPAHNATATLEATLNSLVHQTRGVWEAIIIDDGSGDSTRAVAEHWAQRDRRFPVLHHERLGVCAGREPGLRDSPAPLLPVLDNATLVLGKRPEGR